MSERLKNTNNVSNEAVIEDLTKDLKTLNTTEQNQDEFVINPEDTQSANSAVPEQEEKAIDPPFTDIDLDRDFDDEKETREKESDTDSVDEESLKDAEVDLTDDQKEERKLIADELKVAGNNAFKDGEYERSIEKYTEGLKICPLQFSQQRAVLFCNRSAGKMKLQQYKKAAKDCTRALELDDKYVKAYIRRAQSYEATEKYDESLTDYKKVLEFDPSHKDAILATVRLPPLIEKQNEKLKNEMMGKLKDLGNMILKPFGLSTENFQLEQDAESKGYKINFKQ